MADKDIPEVNTTTSGTIVFDSVSAGPTFFEVRWAGKRIGIFEDEAVAKWFTQHINTQLIAMIEACDAE